MSYIISFDLDGTLVKSGFGDSVWLDGLPRIFAKEKKVSLRYAKQFFYNLYDKIGSDKREWYDLSFWIKKFNLSIIPKTLLDSYENYIELFTDVKPVICRLFNDYKLIICSGAMQEFIQKELEFTGLISYFSNTYSCITDTDTVKKDPGFYRKIATLLQCHPSDIIHIGDSYNYDYYSAKKAGCHAYLLDRNCVEKKPFIMPSLEEFEITIKKTF